MSLRFDERDLDGELVFDRYLGGGAQLDQLQALLADMAPEWCSKLRIRRDAKDQRPIDIDEAGALKAAILAAAAERGSVYRALVERHGQQPLERVVGSAEIRGAGPELILVVSIDEMILSPVGSRWQLGNHIGLQIRRPMIRGRTGDTWMREVFERLCDELSPAWASAGHSAEYWAKVMSDPPRVEAIGRDFGRFLPGVFWLNFFGRRYRELLGDDRLRSTPARRVASIDDGILVELATDPLSWDTPEGAAGEQRVRDHLGPELFFSKAEPNRETVVPEWDS